MSIYTKFAIIGAGGVGGTVVDELLKKGASVTILTRDDSKEELHAFKARGATLIKVAYDDEVALKKALTGSEVAYLGVRVIEGLNSFKQAARDLLTELKLPFTIFYTGVFDEFVSMVLGCNFNEGYMNVVGKGETAFSITPRTDVGRFVAQVLATTPKSALEGAEIAFEAEGLSPLQIRDIAEKKLGKKIEVRHVDYEENKKKVDTDFMAFLTTLLEDGHSLAGSEQEVKANVEKFFPDWNPAKYESFVA
ncbi:hypothetical protein BBO99_00007412 [Phytophthora kernoviae]|uniref:NmrA-like domain-containing protein n=2 Tax=Phytophthora kernoviae TaxID=325452 RepID=A0A421GIB6_9STRA|nr:hypothetical protein G195_008869 [Phytophthora kernoviae 00238/432]KAG2509831.1 hypothetical protein JM16_007712 [Phytophthora kernoviae]KAG2515405.1 hypothetical protein JM18_007816 [Phytophthora kernoviae]RLN13853.1 hypothetical protein BBI17_008073 [Phytophthora kernoviae]RLN76608.1 hypothetical protein BBO99_00007412 [Phytophthora kernoviae]